MKLKSVLTLSSFALALGIPAVVVASASWSAYVSEENGGLATIDAGGLIPFHDGTRYCEDAWPGSADEEHTLRYGSFDLAGNFSGWSDPGPLSLAGCGCSSNHGTSPLALLVLLLGLTRHRRHRPPKASLAGSDERLRSLITLAQEGEQQRHHDTVAGAARAALDLDQRG